MATFIQAILTCLTGSEPVMEAHIDEKRPLLVQHEPRTAEEIAGQVVQVIVRAEKGGKELRKKLNDIVGINGWTERVAEWVLAKLEVALREAKELGPELKEAYNKSWEAAKAVEGFVKEHPVFVTLIAVGVLVIIAPWAIEALGFGELGPIEGSFAAAWQARYAGFVPKGSLFSFFQRLGMVWR